MVLISKGLVFITKEIKMICLHISKKKKEEGMGPAEEERGLGGKSGDTYRTGSHKHSVKQPVFSLRKRPQGLWVFTRVLFLTSPA